MFNEIPLYLYTITVHYNQHTLLCAYLVVCRDINLTWIQPNLWDFITTVFFILTACQLQRLMLYSQTRNNIYTKFRLVYQYQISYQWYKTKKWDYWRNTPVFKNHSIILMKNHYEVTLASIPESTVPEFAWRFVAPNQAWMNFLGSSFILHASSWLLANLEFDFLAPNQFCI